MQTQTQKIYAFSTKADASASNILAYGFPDLLFLPDVLIYFYIREKTSTLGG